MKKIDEASECLNRVRTLLDTYLREFGIISEQTRARWIDRVFEELDTRSVVVASEDILEEAVECMRVLIETRVAAIYNHDPAHDHREIAQILAVLLGEKYADSLNLLFERIEFGDSAGDIERVRNTLVTALPILVPEESPLAMPVQTIELRSINPLRWLLGRSA